jgi:hypothetical protein
MVKKYKELSNKDGWSTQGRHIEYVAFELWFENTQENTSWTNYEDRVTKGLQQSGTGTNTSETRDVPMEPLKDKPRIPCKS